MSGGIALDEERHFGTTVERQVLALEMIADQLRIIAEHLTQGGSLPVDAGPQAGKKTDDERAAGHRFE